MKRVYDGGGAAAKSFTGDRESKAFPNLVVEQKQVLNCHYIRVSGNKWDMRWVLVVLERYYVLTGLEGINRFKNKKVF
jgi:hypothetical protein